MKQTILVICSQTNNRKELQESLVRAELSVTQANQTHDAMEIMVQSNHAFILLDIDVEDSTDFLKMISKSCHFNPPPYILIAASFSNGQEKADMYDLGADACIVKPIKSTEVVALINAVLRREQKIASLGSERLLPCIEHKELLINPVSHMVFMRGEPISFTAKEFDILYLLAKHAGTVLTRDEIYELVWHEDHKVGTASVSDHIHMIRHKLGLNGNDNEYIQTVYHIGYRFASTG